MHNQNISIFSERKKKENIFIDYDLVVVLVLPLEMIVNIILIHFCSMKIYSISTFARSNHHGAYCCQMKRWRLKYSIRHKMALHTQNSVRSVRIPMNYAHTTGVCVCAGCVVCVLVKTVDSFRNAFGRWATKIFIWIHLEHCINYYAQLLKCASIRLWLCFTRWTT